MLSVISCWRAAAIVKDLDSSACYVGWIAEQAVGPASACLVFGVMLFSNAVRAIDRSCRDGPRTSARRRPA
jgi:hypothetical protein